MRLSEETVGSKARSDRWWLAQQRLGNSNTRASGLARRLAVGQHFLNSFSPRPGGLEGKELKRLDREGRGRLEMRDMMVE